MNLLTIVPDSNDCGQGLMPTTRTKVLGLDGEAIGGIKRIELVAEVNDVWRAKIDCYVSVPHPFRVDADVRVRRLSAWQRLCLRLAGLAIDTTDLLSTSRSYAKP